MYLVKDNQLRGEVTYRFLYTMRHNNANKILEASAKKNSLQNLTKLHGVLFQLEILDSTEHINFPKLFIIGKIRGSPCYFLISRGQKIKNVTKSEQKSLILFTFLFQFSCRFSRR